MKMLSANGRNGIKWDFIKGGSALTLFAVYVRHASQFEFEPVFLAPISV